MSGMILHVLGVDFVGKFFSVMHCSSSDWFSEKCWINLTYVCIEQKHFFSAKSVPPCTPERTKTFIDDNDIYRLMFILMFRKLYLKVTLFYICNIIIIIIINNFYICNNQKAIIFYKVISVLSQMPSQVHLFWRKDTIFGNIIFAKAILALTPCEITFMQKISGLYRQIPAN